MLPPAVANAHMKGDIHFHDADYSPFTAQSNCSLPNFWDMLANGFTLGNAPMASPKSIAIAATQITQIMKDVASSQYGGQTANRADEHLAAYAKKDYEKFLEEARETIPDGMPVEFARRQVENAKANEPAKLHFGSREPLPMDTPFHTDVDELEQEREISPRSARASPSTTPCKRWSTRSTPTASPTARPRSSPSALVSVPTGSPARSSAPFCSTASAASARNTTPPSSRSSSSPSSTA